MALNIAVIGGWNIPVSVMKPLLLDLETQCRCPVQMLDYPGYESGYDGSQDWLIPALVERWKPYLNTETVVVGWSLGGMIALSLAACLPLAGVVALGSNVQFQGSAPWQMSSAMFRSFSRQVRSDYIQSRNTFIDLVAAGDSRPDNALKEQLIAAYDTFRPDLKSINDSLAMLGELDVAQTIGTVPQLWIFAKDDALVPVTCVSQIVPQAMTHIRVVSGGHGFPFSAPIGREIHQWCATMLAKQV
jgi:pimeloyl-ACP methyl ester carboxylesterase